ncbi:MAG TPA: SDR family oxidoreductase [Solirubrobacteraceae bacterium]|nr:SDR family oxidoreductase [Solirubrobacteraceae bacterium]
MSDSEHPPQTISEPGHESEMREQPRDEMREYVGSAKLEGKAALITGGDSGIGRAVAVAFAKEGADVAISYLEEDEDARRTAELVEAEGRRAVTLRGDHSEEAVARKVVDDAAEQLGRLDVLVNNIAYQSPVDSFEELTSEQWDRTFKTNVYSFYWCSHQAMRHLPDGGAIINTSSINGLRGNKSLIDYSATKGAVNALTWALAQALMDKGIRVNAVAPGPVWTPLIPATMDEEKVASFGQQAPMERAAQPDEIAPSYVFFASGQLSSYYSGEILAPVGGETLPG